MDAKKNTSELIDELIESTSQIETVSPPPFFKDKVLNKLSNANHKEKNSGFLEWFVPKYQIATLLLFVVLNLTALYIYSSSLQEEDLQTFAEAYGFSDSDGESILN